MLGAIVGDEAGSIYEFDQLKKVKAVKMKKLIEDNAFFSDDTILTCAVADAILNGGDYCSKIKEYTIKYENYKPEFSPYFKTPFSPNFIAWTKSSENGTSAGNGAMMRISPVGWLFETEEEVKENAKMATMVSHNCEESINSAIIVALIIFYARKGLSKQEIVEKLNLKIVKPKIEKFNYLCSDTLPVCLYSVFETNNFEDCIKMALSFGGDTDTNACIAGSMAEALYGIDENVKKQAKQKLPLDLLSVVENFYKRLETNKKQK